MTAAVVPDRRLPRVVPVAIGLSWAVALVAEATGTSALVHHNALEGDLPLWVALGVAVAAWPVMTAAMMLPSSVPMVRLFAAVSGAQPRPRLVLAWFLAGYGVVWTAFGVVALAGDAVLHRVVHAVPWLEAREFLVGAGVLALAGAFQFSGLKERCLVECRHPAAFLMPRYRRGSGPAFRLGLAHGLFCLGCCWALMLVLFATGVGELWWMAALTAVMVAEKVARGGRRLAPVVGLVLLGWAGLVAAQPAWLPAVFVGTG
jgi:predicted metal-binding membrane protein